MSLFVLISDQLIQFQRKMEEKFKIKISPLVVDLHAPLVAHTFNIQIIDEGEYCHRGVGDGEAGG